MGDKKVKRFQANHTNDPFVAQGDIITNVTYTYEVTINEKYVDVIQLLFPYVLVLSQSCDLQHGNRLINKEIKSESKVMFSAIVVPFFEKNTICKGEHMSQIVKQGLIDCNINNEFIPDEEMGVIKNGLHYRYHLLQFQFDNIAFPDYVIDFKTFFTLNLNELMKLKQNRLCRLGDIETQQIVNKFAAFLSRVGISDDKMITSKK